jgi:K(+)-stimulated pyrophosphate-energized sodium pump
VVDLDAGFLAVTRDTVFASVNVDTYNLRALTIGAVIIGIVLAAAIQQLTGYFTETNRRPVDDVAKSSLTGPATVILSGISLGLESAVYSALLLAAAVYTALPAQGCSPLSA